MRRNRTWPPRLVILPFLLLFASALPVRAAVQSADPAQGSVPARIVSPEAAGPQDAPVFRVLSSDAAGVSLELTLPALVSQELTVDGDLWQVLSIPGGDQSGAPGDPMLPVLNRLVRIPDRSGVEVTAKVEDEEEREGFRLLPMQSEDGSAFLLNRDAYAPDAFTSRPVSLAGAPAISRGIRVVPLTLSPVSYNPVQGKVRIARRIRVDVRFSGEDSRNTLSRKPRALAPSFDRLYRRTIVNYPGEGERAAVENGSYLVICPNDPQVTARLQPLLDWRRRQGYQVRLATTAETGTTNSAIKAYIQNAYNTWDPPPEYIALTGDASGSYVIPTWYAGGGEGDLAYTQLDGTDLIGDAHIGRLSFSTLSELEVIVAKTVGYETSPNLGDPSWFTRACLVGDPSESGISTIQVMQWVKTRLRQIGYTEIDTIFGGNFVGQMTTALNRGDSIFAYRGFAGFSGWSNSYTYALTNINKLHFAVISTCGTGSFASGTSNSEAFLRAGSVSAPKAAVGATGTATLSTHTRYNNCFEFGLLQGLLYEDLWEMGAAVTRGRYELYMNYGAGDPTGALDFCTWNNLMGDPACPIFTAIPTALEVSYPDTVALGANSVLVTVNEQGGGPCEGAQVCLLKGAETFAVRTTGADGVCELPVSLATEGTLQLTVTRHNRVPVLADIVVAVRPLFVGYQASSVDDDNAGGSQGNGDGLINPGETIQLGIRLRNFGSQTAGDVTAALTTDDPYVTIVQAQAGFGAIPGGAEAWSAAPFLFTLSPACPDARELLFGLEVFSGTETWHSLVSLRASAPNLVYADSTLYNAGGNYLLDPGETVELSVKLANAGAQGAASVIGTLTSLSPWVTVGDAAGRWSDIPMDGTGENTGDRFTITASPFAYRGSLALFRLALTFNGTVTDTTVFGIRIGQASSTDPVGPDRYGYYAFDNTDVGYVNVPDYAWVELDPAYGGDGTEIVLGDNGDQQDKSRGVDLPFAFRFYGNSFTRATVCSNGWLAMGDTYLTDYRNWGIPGAGTPNNLLAVFWDELVQDSGSKAFRKYDEANHRWIVEWSRFRNAYGGVLETFEAILYDPAFAPTPTGDGPIVFQYHTVNNLEPVDGYATVGIQNSDHTDGVLYTYYNLYPAGAAPLTAGRAIRFVIGAVASAGFIQGTVTNGSNGGTPIPGASIRLLESGRTMISGADGSFSGTVVPGTYTVVADPAGFLPDTLDNVVVTENQTTLIGFSLPDVGGPAIGDVYAVNPVNQPTDPVPVTANITDMSAVVTKELIWRASGGAFHTVPMTLVNGSLYRALIPPQPIGTELDFYLRAIDIAGNPGYFPAGAPDSLHHLTLMQSFFSDDFETDKGWTPYRPSDTQSGRWVRWDPIGTEGGGIQCEPADDHTPPPGTSCYNTGQGQPQGDAEGSDVDNGSVTLTSPQIDLSSAQNAVLSYWRWWAREGASSPFFVAYASSDNGASWVLLEYQSASVPVWTQKTFDLSAFISLTNQVRIRFIASTTGSGGIVEASVDDFSIGGVPNPSSSAPEPPSAVPAVTALLEGRPNPFRGETVLRFTLSEEGPATLAVYDPAGRLVRSLAQGRMAAGEHTIRWDGRDEAGRPVGAGIYFYEMRTSAGGADYRRTRKLLLIR